MRGLLSVTVVLMVGLMMASTEAAKAKKGKGNNNKGAAACKDWQYGSCMPNKGDCGVGVREGTCSEHTKTLKCKVPCNWKKEFGADCKYKFGSWGGCDEATSTKTRPGVLMKALFNAECQPTVTVSKPCLPKTKTMLKTKNKGKKGRLREN